MVVRVSNGSHLSWIVRKSTLISWGVASLYGLTLAGYPLVSALPVLFGMDSRVASVPFRGLVVVLSVAVIFFVSVKRSRGYTGIFLVPLCIFWLFYFIRLLSDTVLFPIPLRLSSVEYFLYSFGMCLIPMLGLMVFVDRQTLNRAFDISVTLAAIACGLALYVNLQPVLSGASSVAGSGRMASETLNSISLGHLGASLAILCGYYLYEKSKFLKRSNASFMLLMLLGLFTVGTAASRGPFLALILVVATFVLLRMRVRYLVRLLSFGAIILIVTSGVAQIIENKLGYSPITRVQSIVEISDDQSTSIRLQLFEDAWSQFLNNPLTGSALEELNSGFYPHNVVLESFMATGIVGGTTFCILVIMSLWSAFQLIYGNSVATWVALLYIQYLVAAMFSGSLYGSNIMWSMMGAVITMHYCARRLSQQEFSRATM